MTGTELEPRVLEIPEFAYHTDQIDDDRPSASRSVLHRLIEKSPAHAKACHPRLNPDWVSEEKTAFDVGTVCHQLLLEGVAGVQVLGYDTWRTNAAKEERDQARAHGLIPLLAKEWEQVEAMMAAVRPQIVALGLFDGGDHELTLAWEDRGVLCRARLDWLSDDRRLILDFKTSSNAEPNRFSRGAFFDYGYDLQDALYRRAVRACFGAEADYRLVVVEKEPPYEVIVFDAAPDVLALANAKLDDALDTWRECLASGSWPGYSKRTHSVTLPPWKEAEWLGRQAVAA